MPQTSTVPSKQHKPKSKAAKTSDDKAKVVEERNTAQESRGPLSKDDQQYIISHFKNALSLTSSSQAKLQSTIQSVKSALYARDFTTAFGNEDFRQAYSARWSPSRSLAYAELLLDDDLKLHTGSFNFGDIVCLGGGAGAELVGLTIAWMLQRQSLFQRMDLGLHIVDVADWTDVLQDLGRALRSLPHEECLMKFDFHQMDLLGDGHVEKLRSLLGHTFLVTMFFTLNELYAASLGRTTQFLLELGDMTEPGTQLCIVDSAGSYAGVVLDQDENENQKSKEESDTSGKRYPMAWMLDHTLLKLSEESKGRKIWQKLQEDKSRWFRRDKTLEYPLPLEDMRYQVHLFERVDDRTNK